MKVNTDRGQSGECEAMAEKNVLHASVKVACKHLNKRQGVRLRQFIRKEFKELLPSQADVRQAIKAGEITVDGEVLKDDARYLAVGSQVEFTRDQLAALKRKTKIPDVRWAAFSDRPPLCHSQSLITTLQTTSHNLFAIVAWKPAGVSITQSLKPDEVTSASTSIEQAARVHLQRPVSAMYGAAIMKKAECGLILLSCSSEASAVLKEADTSGRIERIFRAVVGGKVLANPAVGGRPSFKVKESGSLPGGTVEIEPSSHGVSNHYGEYSVVNLHARGPIGGGRLLRALESIGHPVLGSPGNGGREMPCISCVTIRLPQDNLGPIGNATASAPDKKRSGNALEDGVCGSDYVVSVDIPIRIKRFVDIATSFDKKRREATLLKAQTLRISEEALEKVLSDGCTPSGLAYATGRSTFFGREFRVTDAVMIPREATASIVVKAVDILRKECMRLSKVSTDKDFRPLVIDLGTGSGAIICSLLLANGCESAAGIGVEISEKAADVARQNVQLLGLASRCEVVTGSWEDLKNILAERARRGLVPVLVVCNPPYLSRKRKHEYSMKAEPDLALFAADGGLGAYKSISSSLADCSRSLYPGCALVLEVRGTSDEGHAKYVQELFSPTFEHVGFLRDSKQFVRGIVMNLAETCRSGR